MRFRSSPLIGAALAATLVLAACSGPAESDTPAAVEGGDLVIAWTGTGAQLDIARMNSTSVIDFPIMSAVYGQLVYRTTDGDLEMLLAESLEGDDEGRVWTLTLQDDLKFSDGTPLDADAIVFNLDRFLDPDVGSSKAANLAGVSYEATDDVTVVFELDTPNPMWAHDFAAYFAFPASPTAIEADPEGFQNAPVGAGPFMVDTWIQGDTIRLVPNPHYPEDRAPLLDSITIKAYTDTQQSLNAVSTGSIDMAWTNLPNILRDAEAAGLEIHAVELGGGGIVYPHVVSGPFTDLRARQALLYGIDRQKALDAAYGAGTAATAFFEPDSAWHDPNGLFPEHDPERAQELLDELAAEGTPLKFTYTVNEQNRPMVEAIQTQLLAFDNIEIDVEVLDNAAYTTRMRAGDFEIIYNAAIWDAPYPNLQDYFGTGNARNYYKVSVPEVDDLLAQARMAETTEEQAALYAQVQNHALENVWLINIDHWTIGFVANSNVGGVELIGNGSAMLWEQLGFVE